MKITQEQLERIVENATRDALKTLIKEGTVLGNVFKAGVKNGKNLADMANDNGLDFVDDDDVDTSRKNYSTSKAHKKEFKKYDKQAKEAPNGSKEKKQYSDAATKSALKRAKTGTGISGKINRAAYNVGKKIGGVASKGQRAIGI